MAASARRWSAIVCTAALVAATSAALSIAPTASASPESGCAPDYAGVKPPDVAPGGSVTLTAASSASCTQGFAGVTNVYFFDNDNSNPEAVNFSANNSVIATAVPSRAAPSGAAFWVTVTASGNTGDGPSFTVTGTPTTTTTTTTPTTTTVAPTTTTAATTTTVAPTTTSTAVTTTTVAPTTTTVKTTPTTIPRRHHKPPPKKIKPTHPKPPVHPVGGGTTTTVPPTTTTTLPTIAAAQSSGSGGLPWPIVLLLILCGLVAIGLLFRYLRRGADSGRSRRTWEPAPRPVAPPQAAPVEASAAPTALTEVVPVVAPHTDYFAPEAALAGVVAATRAGTSPAEAAPVPGSADHRSMQFAAAAPALNENSASGEPAGVRQDLIWDNDETGTVVGPFVGQIPISVPSPALAHRRGEVPTAPEAAVGPDTPADTPQQRWDQAGVHAPVTTEVSNGSAGRDHWMLPPEPDASGLPLEWIGPLAGRLDPGRGVAGGSETAAANGTDEPATPAARWGADREGGEFDSPDGTPEDDGEDGRNGGHRQPARYEI